MGKTNLMKQLYFLILFSAAVQAQSFQWLQAPEINLNLNPGMVGYCNAVDSSGNVFFTGFKDNAYSYNEIFGDVFFNKYNDAGELQFSKTFTGRVNVFDLATDGSGNLFMAVGYVDFATIGTLNLNTVNQGIQPLVLKFDTDGNLLWHYEPVIEDSFEPYFRALATDNSGNVYIGYDDFMNSYIEKISADGLSQFTIEQNNAKLISSVDTDTEGNIYVAGSCAESNAVYAGVAVPTTFDYNTWVVKYSPTGIHQWTRYVDDITCSHPKVKANTPDDVYFSSELYGAYEFGSFTAEGPWNNFSGDFFLAKLDASGTFLWVREVPSGTMGTVDTGNRNYLDVNSEGFVTFAGSMRNTITWAEDITTSSQGFGSEALALKYDPNGTLLMAKVFGGTSEDRVDAISFTNQGDLIVSGIVRGNANFDNFSHEAPGVTVYPYLGKISSVILGNGNHPLQSIGLWPNPVSEELHLVNVNAGKGEIFNALGQKILLFETDGNSSIKVSDLASGIYLLKMKGYQVVKFVKS